MDTPDADDAAAIAAVAAGDAASFRPLVERYQQVAFRAAWLITRDEHDAEDITQEAFVRAFRKIHTFRRGEPFRPWLLRIVHNQALNAIRKKHLQRGLVERMGALSPVAHDPPGASAESGPEADEVLAAISRLPAEDRMILHLRYFLDLPEREIAAAIGRRPGTVKSRLHRASARLRDVIEREFPQLKEGLYA